MGQARDNNWIPELWALYSIGAVVLLSRIVLRCWVYGFSDLAAEDYVSYLIPVFYTVSAAGCYLVYTNGHKGDFTQAEINALTYEETRRVIFGTKWELVLTYLYPSLLWLFKASMLLLYWRLTRKLERPRLLIRLTAIACLLTYIGVMLTISLACMPFRGYWQTSPLRPPNCLRSADIFIALAVSNIL
ncbi:hypothetical protein ETB97_002258 [Aspergillus alliaceus]|uniref:Rhodopsin domain-containing protein n=1 Tax=Petromyces alliaceus TaxID=209559 RepID=A0A8H6A2R1_PETAA|nr:hypothetical protein ETB97_002258 [Aspergillus burnettii]